MGEGWGGGAQLRSSHIKAVIQRVSRARVTVLDHVTGQIGPGLLVLLCAEQGDGPDQADLAARKIANLRIFEDDAGKMNLSLLQTGGAALVVSQFTLAADLRRGHRPGFSGAARPDIARDLCERFCRALAGHRIPVETGVFAADMAVELTNDGPVTIIWDSSEA